MVVNSDFIVVTNNPMVYERLREAHQVEHQEKSDVELLRGVRDLIHRGHTLLTHPMAGSIKPNETPYKSIMLSKEKRGLDLQSVKIIEESIQVCEKFIHTRRSYEQEIMTDFQSVDCSLIEHAIARALA